MASALCYCSQHQLVGVSKAITCDSVKQSYACGKAFKRVHDKHGSFVPVTQPARCPQILTDGNASFISEVLQVQYVQAPKVDALHNLLVDKRQLQIVHLSANSQGQCLMITPQNHALEKRCTLHAVLGWQASYGPHDQSALDDFCCRVLLSRADKPAWVCTGLLQSKCLHAFVR